MKEIVIVGAGLFGITLAERLSNSFKILLIDKRDVIGGNCYDYTDPETGILIHKYGPHIFHIKDENILNYVRKFTEFNNYKHQVRSCYRNKIFEFPINLSTINSFYDLNLRPFEVKQFLFEESQKAHIVNPQNMEEKIISLIGEDLYKAFFKEYTIKQWGKAPAQLPESIISRIPIKENYDTNYYKKPFNGMPSYGYTSMFEKMLNHQNITVQLKTDFFSDRNYFLNKPIVIFTGPIDAFFEYKHGKLEYRSLMFVEERHHVNDFQGVAVINYPELVYEYTRICEPKHFYPEKWNLFEKNSTVIFKEISFAAKGAEPYYPIQNARNAAILQKYINESKNLDNVYFGGRLGEYKYYDMEDTIRSAISLSKVLLAGQLINY